MSQAAGCKDQSTTDQEGHWQHKYAPPTTVKPCQRTDNWWNTAHSTHPADRLWRTENWYKAWSPNSEAAKRKPLRMRHIEEQVGMVSKYLMRISVGGWVGGWGAVGG